MDTYSVAFAKACRIKSCLVLTGNAKKRDLEGAASKPQELAPSSVAELNLP